MSSRCGGWIGGGGTVGGVPSAAGTGIGVKLSSCGRERVRMGKTAPTEGPQDRRAGPALPSRILLSVGSWSPSRTHEWRALLLRYIRARVGTPTLQFQIPQRCRLRHTLRLYAKSGRVI